jgi:hypothetical protein
VGLDSADIFETLKKNRGKEGGALDSLRGLGDLAEASLRTLAEPSYQPTDIGTSRIDGHKRYGVYASTVDPATFSRAVNLGLFIHNATEFASEWRVLTDRFRLDSGTFLLDYPADGVNRLFYTAVMSYAAVVDLRRTGNRGGPGTLFEIATEAAISQLTGLKPLRGVLIRVPGMTKFYNVRIDMTFGDSVPTLPASQSGDLIIEGEEPEPGEEDDAMEEAPDQEQFVLDLGEPATGMGRAAELSQSRVVLAVPTKLSTRERIVQAYAHQRILDQASPGRYRTILCACNENNMIAPKRKRTATTALVSDTLVPWTIAVYQQYVARLEALYYLDPPQQYVDGRYQGLPPVRTFGQLLTGDARTLLGTESNAS